MRAVCRCGELAASALQERVCGHDVCVSPVISAEPYQLSTHDRMLQVNMMHFLLKSEAAEASATLSKKRKHGAARPWDTAAVEAGDEETDADAGVSGACASNGTEIASLASLVGRYLGAVLDKGQQTANDAWERPELPQVRVVSCVCSYASTCMYGRSCACIWRCVARSCAPMPSA